MLISRKNLCCDVEISQQLVPKTCLTLLCNSYTLMANGLYLSSNFLIFRPLKVLLHYISYSHTLSHTDGAAFGEQFGVQYLEHQDHHHQHHLDRGHLDVPLSQSRPLKKRGMHFLHLCNSGVFTTLNQTHNIALIYLETHFDCTAIFSFQFE